jgi:hypothetical protein
MQRKKLGLQRSGATGDGSKLFWNLPRVAAFIGTRRSASQSGREEFAVANTVTKIMSRPLPQRAALRGESRGLLTPALEPPSSVGSRSLSLMASVVQPAELRRGMLVGCVRIGRDTVRCGRTQFVFDDNSFSPIIHCERNRMRCGRSASVPLGPRLAAVCFGCWQYKVRKSVPHKKSAGQREETENGAKQQH